MCIRDRYAFLQHRLVKASDKNMSPSKQSMQSIIAARALATYLVPGCVGRGVRLGSESSSAAASIWKSGNLKIGKSGDSKIWESENLEI